MTNKRTEWLEARRNGVGASDAVVLLCGSKWRTEEDVLASKLGPVEELSNPDIRRGNLYEILCLDQWALSNPEWEILRGSDDPMALTFRVGHCHASLDALAVGPHGEVLILEVKSPRCKKARDTEMDGPDPAWVVQVQYQLEVCRRSGADMFGDGWNPEARAGARVLVWHPEEARYHEHVIEENPGEWRRTEFSLCADGSSQEKLIEHRDGASHWVDYCDAWFQRHVIEGEPLAPPSPFVPLPRYELDIDLSGTPDGSVVSWYAVACEDMRRAENAKSAALAALSEVATTHRSKRLMADGYRITRVCNSGRKSTNIKAIQTAYPEIQWSDYEITGAEYATWRVTGGK